MGQRDANVIELTPWSKAAMRGRWRLCRF